MEESVRGAPAESAKVKSSAIAPTRSFCPSLKLLLQPNRRSAAYFQSRMNPCVGRGCSPEARLQPRHKNPFKDSFPFGGILAELSGFSLPYFLTLSSGASLSFRRRETRFRHCF